MKQIFFILIILSLNGCEYLDKMFDFKQEKKSYAYSENAASENILIIDNDSYDPDYIPLVLNAINESKKGNINIGLIIISEHGLSNKTNVLYKSILNEFNSNIPLTLAHKTNDRSFRSKLTNNLESYTDITHDNEMDDAIEVLENKLESQNDKSVTYATGGKLIFLSKFISNPARLELFKLKVKKVVFGLDCGALDNQCSNDFNLAATKKAYKATKDVYNKLHGDIPFVVVNDKRGKASSNRALDIFKKANIPLMTHLLSTDIYGTYGDHNNGDVEILFSQSRKENFNSSKCNLKLINKSFKAKDIGKNGNDIIYVNKSLNINKTSKEAFKSLINAKN